MKKLIKFLSFTFLATFLSIVGFLKKDSQNTPGSITLGDALSLEKAHADVPSDPGGPDPGNDDDCDEDEDEDEDC